MTKTGWIAAFGVLAAVGLWTVAGIAKDGDRHDVRVVDDQPDHHGTGVVEDNPAHHAVAAAPATQPAHPSHMVAARLAALTPALDDLEKAINAGDKDASLAKLKVVRGLALKANMAASGFANTTCPIMGGSFDPAHMSADNLREWKGQKIGFCCSGCPEAWDKLTDAEKQAKLDAAK